MSYAQGSGEIVCDVQDKPEGLTHQNKKDKQEKN